MFIYKKQRKDWRFLGDQFYILILWGFAFFVTVVLHILISNNVPFSVLTVFQIVTKRAELRLLGLLYHVSL